MGPVFVSAAATAQGLQLYVETTCHVHPFVLKKQVMAGMSVGQVCTCPLACSVCRRLWLEDPHKS